MAATLGLAPAEPPVEIQWQPVQGQQIFSVKDPGRKYFWLYKPDGLFTKTGGELDLAWAIGY